MRGIPALVALLALVVVAGLPAAADARSCKSLYSKGLKLKIEKTGNVSCGRARKLIRVYWIESRGVRHGGGYLYNSWYTVPGFKGWKCFEGSGGGHCDKGRKASVYYQSVVL